jgi:hypothetical protein
MASLVIQNPHTGERLALRRVMRDGQLALELKGTRGTILGLCRGSAWPGCPDRGTDAPTDVESPSFFTPQTN